MAKDYDAILQTNTAGVAVYLIIDFSARAWPVTRAGLSDVIPTSPCKSLTSVRLVNQSSRLCSRRRNLLQNELTCVYVFCGALVVRRACS